MRPMPFHLRFESTLASTREQLWQWITSPEGIRSEMRPWLHLSMPEGVRSLEDLDFRPGEVLYRSQIRLFGFLPVGSFHLTLLELTPNDGFIEQSPITGMKLWRHERRLMSCAEADGHVTLVDEVTVEPYFGTALVKAFVRAFFDNRHRVLRERFASEAIGQRAVR